MLQWLEAYSAQCKANKNKRSKLNNYLRLVALTTTACKNKII